ncbi:MAG: hypothetical protein SW833_17815 [Cyanobacteriota bacterium]|nr:hypothetical protein [Cyanobacteriota bacterium]
MLYVSLQIISDRLHREQILPPWGMGNGEWGRVKTFRRNARIPLDFSEKLGFVLLFRAGCVFLNAAGR